MIAAVCAVLLTGTSCATAQQVESGAVFASPDTYVGKDVVVCGYLSGVSNILQTRRDVRTGLSILVGEELAYSVRRLSQRTRACLGGTIEHLGCNSSAICTDWDHDYAIRVNRLR
jgi:hypothetical protein